MCLTFRISKYRLQTDIYPGRNTTHTENITTDHSEKLHGMEIHNRDELEETKRTGSKTKIQETNNWIFYIINK